MAETGQTPHNAVDEQLAKIAGQNAPAQALTPSPAQSTVSTAAAAATQGQETPPTVPNLPAPSAPPVADRFDDLAKSLAQLQEMLTGHDRSLQSFHQWIGKYEEDHARPDGRYRQDPPYGNPFQQDDEALLPCETGFTAGNTSGDFGAIGDTRNPWIVVGYTEGPFRAVDNAYTVAFNSRPLVTGFSCKIGNTTIGNTGKYCVVKRGTTNNDMLRWDDSVRHWVPLPTGGSPWFVLGLGETGLSLQFEEVHAT